MPLQGLVLNRVHRVAAEALSAEDSLAAAAALDGPAADVLRIHAALAAQVARETAVAARFTEEYPGVPVVPVAAQPADVHDLDGLREIGASLSAGQLPRRGG